MTSFLDRLKQKMTGGPGAIMAPKVVPPRKARTTIETNRWDERVWDEVRQTKPIDEFVVDLMNGDDHKGGSRKPYEMAPEVVHDLFMACYKAEPVLRTKRAVERESYAVRKLMEELLDSPQLKELQEFTASDPLMSTIATQSMQSSVVEIITRVPPPPPPPSPPSPQGQQGQGGGGGGQPSSGQGQGQGQGGNGGGDQSDDPGDGDPQGQGSGGGDPSNEGGHDQEGDGGTDPNGESEFDPDSEEDDPAEADWEKEFDNILDDLNLDMDMAAAVDKAKEEVEELDGLRKGVGIDDGTWERMSPEERMKVAARLRTPQMKELSDVIGRMRRFALGTRATRITNVPHEAYDVEQGNNLNRLLKAQFAFLGGADSDDPDLAGAEYEFYRRLADSELLQFKMRGSEDAGKGPIVICIDKSGSMSGSPFHWALGVAEALRRFAADDERDFYALFFGSNNDRNRFDFPKGKGPWEKIEAFLSVVANGGTQFDGVLTEALKKASDSYDQETKGKADIVFVTDGQAHLDETWIDGFNKERERVGVRVYSVYIGGAYDYYGSEGPEGLLNKISDAVITVKDLKPESAAKIFESV